MNCNSNSDSTVGSGINSSNSSNSSSSSYSNSISRGSIFMINLPNLQIKQLIINLNKTNNLNIIALF